jgi:hypothetical protein
MKEDQQLLTDLVRLLAGKTDVTDEFGTALLTTPGAQVQDTSQFNAESTTPLGANGVFNGAWRDTLNYNWFGAQAWADVAGTIYIDEADAATPTVTGLVVKGTMAATDGNAPTPPSGGFVSRQQPVKPVLRFCRARYINGAGAQARFNLQSSLSPLN